MQNWYSFQFGGTSALSSGYQCRPLSIRPFGLFELLRCPGSKVSIELACRVPWFFVPIAGDVMSTPESAEQDQVQEDQRGKPPSRHPSATPRQQTEEAEQTPSKDSKIDHFLKEEAAAYSDGSPTTLSATDDALARLDAAVDDSTRRLASGSWHKSWHIGFGAAALIGAFLIWNVASWLVQEPEGVVSEVSAATAAEEAGNRMPFVLVRFADTASIGEVSEAMKALNLEISSGPVQDGLYRVTIPAATNGDYDVVTARLQRSPVVSWLVAGRRPE